MLSFVFTPYLCALSSRLHEPQLVHHGHVVHFTKMLREIFALIGLTGGLSWNLGRHGMQPAAD